MEHGLDFVEPVTAAAEIEVKPDQAYAADPGLREEHNAIHHPSNTIPSGLIPRQIFRRGRRLAWRIAPRV